MNKSSQIVFDLFRLMPMRNEPAISDDEASALYKLWMSMAPGSARVAATESKDIKALVAKGLVRTAIGGIEITDKGREVIVDMVTHFPNALDRDAKIPSYRDIKSRATRSRQTFVKRAGKDRRAYNRSQRSQSK